MPSPPKTQYTKSGDLHIVYQVTGKGPFDLVFVPGFVSHLESSPSSAAKRACRA